MNRNILEKKRGELDLTESDYEILIGILKNYPYRFYIYGSRVVGRARRYSDIDIYSSDKMKKGDLCNLSFDLEESDLTIKADVNDASSCSGEFKERIKNDLLEIVVE
jgi:predicted nucleotidyltransferase